MTVVALRPEHVRKVFCNLHLAIEGMPVRANGVRLDRRAQVLESGGDHARKAGADAANAKANHFRRPPIRGEAVRGDGVGLRVQSIVGVTFGHTDGDRVGHVAGSDFVEYAIECGQGTSGALTVLLPRSEERMRGRQCAASERRRKRMEAVAVGEDRVGDARFELAEVDEDRAHVVVRHPRQRRAHPCLQAADDVRWTDRPFVPPIGQHAGAIGYNDRAA